eukprot:Rmarinus@m.18752
MASIVTTPFDLVKCRMQVLKHPGMFSCVQGIYRQHGIPGFFVGLSSTMLRDTPTYGLYFLVYEYTLKAWAQQTGACSTEDVGAAGILTAGGLAGVSAWGACYPVDVCKTRMQTQTIVKGQPPRYSGLIDCAIKSYKAEGYRVFF